MVRNASSQQTRVTRSLRPGQPGTIKLRRQHGSALLCVRYRENEAGTLRYTTIELVIDTRPVHSVAKARVVWVCVTLQGSDRDLRKQLIAQGARWDGISKTWTMPLTVARALNLIPVGRKATRQEPR